MEIELILENMRNHNDFQSFIANDATRDSFTNTHMSSFAYTVYKDISTHIRYDLVISTTTWIIFTEAMIEKICETFKLPSDANVCSFEQTKIILFSQQGSCWYEINVISKIDYPVLDHNDDLRKFSTTKLFF